MLLLTVYILVALGFSFYCSIAEAVLLSISRPFVSDLENRNAEKGRLLRHLKDDIERPLSAILTLNTIAHTMGAAGAGAQAALVFGNAYIGVISAILTLLILVFSEIIPKTLGAHYWRQLAVPVAMTLKWLTWLLYPFVLLSQKITNGMKRGKEVKITRDEMMAMAELGEDEGELESNESRILRNLFKLRKKTIRDIMTPRSVVFSISENMKVGEFFASNDEVPFSRIPVYGQSSDFIHGFVLRNDLLLAHARGNSDEPVSTYCRELKSLPDQTSVLDAFATLLDTRAHILLVMNDIGEVMGVTTLEDIIETLLGMEIVDESDNYADMQKLARMLWKKRAQVLVSGNRK